ncbi:hypothetical protein [Desulfosarcina ovata]|nr:hypothetical protein [Desulfosarcina ovata]
MQCLSNSFRRIIANMDGCQKGEFLFPSAFLIQVQPELATSQLNALAKAGQEIVLNGFISPETVSAVNQEYIDDPAAIIEMQNQFFQGGKI